MKQESEYNMERKLAIVTDSSCDIPQELAEKYGIAEKLVEQP